MATNQRAAGITQSVSVGEVRSVLQASRQLVLEGPKPNQVQYFFG